MTQAKAEQIIKEAVKETCHLFKISPKLNIKFAGDNMLFEMDGGVPIYKIDWRGYFLRHEFCKARWGERWIHVYNGERNYGNTYETEKDAQRVADAIYMNNRNSINTVIQLYKWKVGEMARECENLADVAEYLKRNPKVK